MINEMLREEKHSSNVPKTILEWQPTLFETPATVLLRMDFEREKISHEKTRKALFARNDFLYKELETVCGVVSDLAEAYAELSNRLGVK